MSGKRSEIPSYLTVAYTFVSRFLSQAQIGIRYLKFCCVIPPHESAQRTRAKPAKLCKDAERSDPECAAYARLEPCAGKDSRQFGHILTDADFGQVLNKYCGCTSFVHSQPSMSIMSEKWNRKIQLSLRPGKCEPARLPGHGYPEVHRCEFAGACFRHN